MVYQGFIGTMRDVFTDEASQTQLLYLQDPHNII